MSNEGRIHSLFLEDIMQAIEKIETYTKNLTLDEFRAGSMAVDAVIRNLEVIGESSKNISQNIKEKYPHVDMERSCRF